MIPFPGPLREARFLRRDNRFRATVLLDGCEVAAHIANSERLAELCVARRLGFISPRVTLQGVEIPREVPARA